MEQIKQEPSLVLMGPAIRKYANCVSARDMRDVDCVEK